LAAVGEDASAVESATTSLRLNVKDGCLCGQPPGIWLLDGERRDEGASESGSTIGGRARRRELALDWCGERSGASHSPKAERTLHVLLERDPQEAISCMRLLWSLHRPVVADGRARAAWARGRH